MELLILKSKSHYIRCKDDAYFFVNLDKASVFPMEKIETVKMHKSCLEKHGFKKVIIKKLILSEEDL